VRSTAETVSRCAVTFHRTVVIAGKAAVTFARAGETSPKTVNTYINRENRDTLSLVSGNSRRIQRSIRK
jgi:hypothetical protein